MKNFSFFVFVLAILLGAKTTWAQCASGELNPAAGTPYTYEISVSGNGTEPTYQWYVTKNADLLLESAFLVEGTLFTVGAGGGFSTYRSTQSTTSKIQLTWTAAAVTDGGPFYLVVKYSEKRSGNCVVENMKAWKIQPSNAVFTLAVASVDSNGDASSEKICPPNIDGADVNATGTVTYTYGTTTLYYKITASGMDGTWIPSVQLPVLTGAQTYQQNYLSVAWSSNGTTWNALNADVNGNYTSSTTAAVTTAGSAITLKIDISNMYYESLIEQTITIGIDGVANDNILDVVSSSDCTPETPFGKAASHTIMARPEISSTGVQFMAKQP